MSCQEDQIRLGDYVDGSLDAVERARVTEHLESCPECRAIVSDFSALRVATRSLPPALPGPHVWPKIAGAVEARARGRRWLPAIGAFGSWRAAAATAVIAVTLGAGAWIASLEVAPRQGAGNADAAGSTPATSAEALQSVETEMKLAEDHYARAIAALEQITSSEGSSLDGQTAEVLRTNLAIIDNAIGQSRKALEAEPASDVAQESLFDALRSKVALLQDTVALINEMRKGNPEGAARIVSEMNK